MSLARYHADRVATQNILEDLELQAQSPRRTNSWQPNSLHQFDAYGQEYEVTTEQEQDGYYASGTGEGVELDEEDYNEEGVLQVDNTPTTTTNDNEQPAKGKCTKSTSTAFFVIKHHIPLLFILLALSAIIAASILFSPARMNPGSNERSANAGNDMEEEEEGVESTPTFAPTAVWETYAPTVGLTYSPTEGSNDTTTTTTTTSSPSLSSVVDIIIMGNNVTNNGTDDFESEGNETTASTEEEEEKAESLESDDDNSTSLSTELTETSSTAVVAATTVDASSSFAESTTTTTEASATSTTEAVTTFSTSDAATTSTTEAAAAATSAVTPSPHLCSDTTAGKIFKIVLTPTSSTTSLSLLKLDTTSSSGEYEVVTTYPTNDEPPTLLQVGAKYVDKLCVIPGKYKFVISESEGACYTGFLRGGIIFDKCDGDGEYEFEF